VVIPSIRSETIVSEHKGAASERQNLTGVVYPEELMAIEGVPSLYERLGGVYSIATVMDDFIDRIMIDPRLNANPRVDEAHHRVSPPGFKYLVTEMVCWATGGPQKYTGRSMKDSHQKLPSGTRFSMISNKPLTSSPSPRPSRRRSRP
jgi:truncated hemoglobin YjbI